MKFSIKDFFSKWNQICRKLRIWSHLKKKYLMENFICCAVLDTVKTFKEIQMLTWRNTLVKLSYVISIPTATSAFYFLAQRADQLLMQYHSYFVNLVPKYRPGSSLGPFRFNPYLTSPVVFPKMCFLERGWNLAINYFHWFFGFFDISLLQRN